MRDILNPIELVDLRITVIHGEDDLPPAIAVVCDSMGQLDLGWIETSDAPIAWRAAAYGALEESLGRVLPVFGYRDLFEEYAACYWDGETDDETARQCLVDYHGVNPDDLDEHTLPSTMNALRPEWMISANAAQSAELPARIRAKLDRLRALHHRFKQLRPEQDAWHLDMDLLYDYVPGIEECASLPPLTLVPFDQFARELDNVAQYGMELGFMDVAGLCALPEASRIDDWFASLRLGAQFLLAVQELIQLDPANP